MLLCSGQSADSDFEILGYPPKAGQLACKAGALCASTFPNRSLGTRSADSDFEILK